jgi:RHS repeat-associated protein
MTERVFRQQLAGPCRQSEISKLARLPSLQRSPRSRGRSSPDTDCPNRLTIVLESDADANLTSVLDANGVTTTYTFDDANRMTGVSYSSGGSVGYTYDALGRTLTMTDAHGTTSWTYDHLGRVTEVDQPGRSAVTYTYDDLGNRTSVTSGGKTVAYTYTPTNALASATDWASRTTSYTYDDAGRPATVGYPNTIAAAYTIDPAGRVTNLAYSKGGNALAAFGYTFNGEGQRLTETSPDGTTTYGYDNLGRLTSATYPGSTPAETFGYDAVGNRTSRTASSVTTSYSYNDANELASSSVSGSTSTYAYDDNGNRTSRSVTPTTDTSAPTVPADPSATATAFNSVSVSWTASSDDRAVTVYRIYRDSTLIATVSGSVTSFVDASVTGSTTYAYTIAALDAAGNASSQSSAADATTPSGTPPADTTAPSVPTDLSGSVVGAGRIDLAWSASSDNVAVAGYAVYRDGNKITSVPVGSTSYSDTGLTPGVSHTYTVTALDAAANESAGSGSWSGAASDAALLTTYAYDAANRLTQVATAGQTLGTYTYDGAGDRIAKTTASGSTAYTLDLASGLPQVLSETTGASTSTYAYAGGPLELDIAGSTNWYLTDPLGSVRLVTDASGDTPATYAYAAFGSTRSETGSLPNEVRFTGERTDNESGLEFLRARTYDPATGTFLQRDTWGITATDSQSIDPYAYVGNSPVNGIDPSGHCGIFDPLGCASDLAGGVGNKVSDFAGGVGNAVTNPGQTWADTGGGVVNNIADTGGAVVRNVSDWVQKNPATTALLLTAGACGLAIATGGAASPLCVQMAIGAGIGAGTYTGSVVVGNAVNGKGLSLEGFDTERLSLNMVIGGVSSGAGWGASKAVSALASGSSKVTLSVGENLAIQAGVGGPASTAATLLPKLATSTLSPWNALTPITTMVAPLVKTAAAKWLLPKVTPYLSKLPIIGKLLPGVPR